MNMNMFNPEMMNQMKNMIDGKSMKNMLGNIANMSDEQIKMYLSVSGMSHMSPQTFRQMAGQYKNMDENELERMKNMAPNIPTGFPTNTTNNVAAGNNPANTNQNIKTNPSLNKKITSNTSSTSDFNFSSQSHSIIEKLDKIKIEGNNFFRIGKYKEACEKYYEILNEMSYISDSDKNNNQKQLEEMEVVCRLNIANTKLKQDDYDLAIHECLKVLNKSENFKAHYRAGIAYFKKGSHHKALHHLTKAKSLNKDGDVEVDKYLKECKKFVDDREEEKKKIEVIEQNKQDILKENFENSKKTEAINANENIKQSEQSNEKKIQEDSFKEDEIKFKTLTKPTQEQSTNEPKKTSSKIEKLKEIVDKEVKTESSTNKSNRNQDDIIVEEKVNYGGNNNINTQQTINPGFIQNMPNNMNERMSHVQKELENMDDSQFEGMVGMLRSMDNATIKSMMAMQGMNMSDQQIEMMKNIDPQMLQMAKKNKMNFNQGGINTNGNVSKNIPNTTDTNAISNNNQRNDTLPPQNNPFPNMNNMDINGMLKMIQDNPQLMNMMGPQMANMFGGNEANSQLMMNSMQNILWLISLPQRIKEFFKSTRGLLFLSIFVILILAYYYR